MSDVTANAYVIITKMILLFNEYKEDFGLEDPECLQRSCDFEDKFKALICEYEGHDIGSDQCGIPEHDYCYKCGELKTTIEMGA